MQADKAPSGLKAAATSDSNYSRKPALPSCLDKPLKAPWLP